jgi:ADP-heptose:LPS heptosyltransferase
MNVAKLRLIDTWVGIPACALLTVWRKLLAPFSRRPAGTVERILFVKLAEQGSTVLAYPALQRAIDRVGRENVWFLVFEENRSIVDALGVIPTSNVVTIRAGRLRRIPFDIVKALWKLRRLHLDAAIDLEFYARSAAILTYLSRAKRRVGLHAYSGDGPWRGDLMTHRLAYNPHIHTSQFFDLQVRALDHPSDDFPVFDAVPSPVADMPSARFVPSVDELEAVRGMLRDVVRQSDVPRLVLLNANCSDLIPMRRWAAGNYVEVARRLLDEQPDLWVGLTGAPSEAQAVDAIVAEIGSPRCVSFAGRTTLRQLLVLYGLAQVLVTNDSGPAHFASLTSIDVITLFGPETPTLFGVVSERSHPLWAQTACSPCVSAYTNRVLRCRNNICMQLISVDEVYAKVRQILSARLVEGPGTV